MDPDTMTIGRRMDLTSGDTRPINQFDRVFSNEITMPTSVQGPTWELLGWRESTPSPAVSFKKASLHTSITSWAIEVSNLADKPPDGHWEPDPKEVNAIDSAEAMNGDDNESEVKGSSHSGPININKNASSASATLQRAAERGEGA